MPIRKVKSTGRNALCSFSLLKMEMMISVERLQKSNYVCCADFY